MMQFSVYIRHCPSMEVAAVHIRRLNAALPDKGHVSVVTITDKQFSMIQNFWGKQKKRPKQAPCPQLELF